MVSVYRVHMASKENLMSLAEDIRTPSPVLSDLGKKMHSAVGEVDALFAIARKNVSERVTQNGRISADAIESEQHRVHGLAWFATYAETLRTMAGWHDQLKTEGRLGELEQLLAQICFGEYLNHIAGGIAMNSQESIRLHELDVPTAAIAKLYQGACGELVQSGSGTHPRARLVELMIQARANLTTGDCGLDPMLDEMRSQMKRFIEEHVAPYAHDWHLNNEYVPLDIIEKLAGLGVFALTLPEEFGGMGLGKESMCVVSEELSRGWIAIGSLGTRPEIAAELIIAGGTQAQKEKWLPKIATGEILPTAVFTEPNTGSDLASLRTRAVKDGDTYKITGNKTWITHPVRADVMTLLVRTNPDEAGYKGLSMFLAEKPRGSDDNPFPADGMSGGEIEVLGYRGMKEYEIAFDSFEVKAENLLGEQEGQGFKQLMQTFQIQRASRPLPAQSALLKMHLILACNTQLIASSLASQSFRFHALPTSLP